MTNRPPRTKSALVALAFILACTFVTPIVASDDTQIELGIGGTGGVYFLAEPGQLVVDVEKRDLNRRGRRTELQAILVGPDRQVLKQITIPDDGKPRGSGTGPRQRVHLSVPVERKGVYGLNVTVSQDRYGEEIIWGFRTNCPHYLIETARGHRDQRREEPIVLLNPERPGEVCFLPRKGRFAIEAMNIPDGVETLHVYDEQDTLIHALPVAATGRASHTFSADKRRSASPWRLHLPSQQATIQIDGVTRWDKEDLYPNLPYWTPDPTSYFPFQQYRWILTPYSRTVYAQPGEQAEIAFQVHNNSGERRTIQLNLEFPNDPWPARLSTKRVVLGAKQATEVKVRYTAPVEDQTRVCHVRATPTEDPSFSTYSTLTVKVGVSPATQPLETPIVLRPYQHENEQFGYAPDYPVENQMYFDLENRPFVRTTQGIGTLRNKRWTNSDLQTTVRSPTAAAGGRSFAMVSTKLAFDRDNDLYAVTMRGRQATLLHSTDKARTFSAYPIPGREDRPQVFDIEQFSGHNVPGAPTYVATYDREKGELGPPALVGYGAPANDVHNTPSITIDSQGYLHAMVGTHGRLFQYARSLKPNDAHSGWTEAVAIGEDLRQTYIGLVCGPDDTLHCVFRLWRFSTEPFPASHHAVLAYQRKRPGKPWEPPRTLIVPPFSEYSIFYHRLTIDRAGHLFLSYDYWSTYWFYRTDHWGTRRALLMSSDNGGTWELGETPDLQ